MIMQKSLSYLLAVPQMPEKSKNKTQNCIQMCNTKLQSVREKLFHETRSNTFCSILYSVLGCHSIISDFYKTTDTRV